MLRIAGHIFWYASERPDRFSMRLFEALTNPRSQRWTLVNQSGVRTFRTKDASDRSSQMAVAWGEKINQISAKSSLSPALGNAEISLVYTPSPLSSQYDPFVEGRRFPTGATHDQISLYHSLGSNYSYAKGRDLKEYPHLLQISIADTHQHKSAEELVRLIGAAVVACAAEENFRWLGVLDASPHLMPPIVPNLLLGRADPITSKLDRYLLAQSYLTMGTKDTLTQLRDRLSTSYPVESLTYQENGRAALLMLGDIDAVKRIFVPDWHQSTR
jgi:hypothetical protein